MPKKSLAFFIFLFSGIILANTAYAVCPVCVVAVGSGVGVCRWLGIDDAISGLWIGGLIVSIIIWFLRWLSKKQFNRVHPVKYRFAVIFLLEKLFNRVNFKFSWLLVSVLFYVLSIWPLYSFNIIGHPLNKFLGVDKLLFGIIFGSIVFLISYWLNIFLKNKNQGKVFFPYQKVVLPLTLLLITSIIFYYVIKCY